MIVSSMLVVDTIDRLREKLRAVRLEGKSIGFVPTMGALHDGHLELVRTAKDKNKCDFLVVSIFVNPIQFGPNEDYQRYPKPIENDLEKCRAQGVDLVFNPTVDVMYRQERFTTVSVGKLTDTLCGGSRAGHFDGVTTVIAKLFNMVQPDIAYFGQKDAQQALVLRRMVVDLNFSVAITIVPTVRDADGLALSSRNEYLSGSEIKQARSLYRVVFIPEARTATSSSLMAWKIIPVLESVIFHMMVQRTSMSPTVR